MKQKANRKKWCCPAISLGLAVLLLPFSNGSAPFFFWGNLCNDAAVFGKCSFRGYLLCAEKGKSMAYCGLFMLERRRPFLALYGFSIQAGGLL
ncbi:MAG: hypothetical protein ACLVKK_03140 [Ruthenibacterium sp.]